MADPVVIGQPLDQTILNQLEQRSAVQSSTGFRDEDNILYRGTKNAWVKLSSFIRLIPGSAGANRFGEEFELAKKWVLKAEAKNPDAQGNYNLSKFGVAINTGAYGTGGVDEVGYRPMPGITGVTLESQPPLGAVRSATIKIRAWTLEQLSIIDILYFRLGCCMLLEWGHSIFEYSSEKKKGTLGKDIQTIDIFKSTDVCNEALLKELANKRKEYDHNYDGMIGRVVNFEWSLNPDGSYECVVKLVGLGTVIESLKINGQGAMPVPLTTGDDTTAPDTNQTQPPDSSGIELFLTNIVKYSEDPATYYENVKTNCFGPGLDLLADTTSESAFKYGYSRLYLSLAPGQRFALKDIPPINFTALINFFRTQISKVENGEVKTATNVVYIPLGSLLAYINNSCLMYDKSCGTQKPAIYIDFNPDTNLCLRIPSQFSIDPGVCYVHTDCSEETYQSLFTSRKVKVSDIVTPEPKSPANSDIFTTLNQLPSYIAGQDKGKIMNILVNVDCIRSTLLEHRDNDNTVALSAFLGSLMGKIQKALGNINTFTVGYSEDANAVIVYDAQIVGGADFKVGSGKDGIPYLPVFGLKSIVRDIKLKTNISSNLNSSLAITARAGARNTGTSGDQSSFTRLNNSIEDRLFKNITTTPKEEEAVAPTIVVPYAAPAASPASPAFGALISGQAAIATATANAAAQQKAEAAAAELAGLTKVANTFNQQIAQYYKLTDGSIKYDAGVAQSIQQYYQDSMQIVKNGGQSSVTDAGDPSSITATGVLPLNISLTLDGIGGIPLFQSFTLPPDRLPLVYLDEKTGQPRVAFVVVGVNHTIEGNQWVTTLTGNMFNIPKGQGVATKGFETTSKLPPKERNIANPKKYKAQKTKEVLKNLDEIEKACLAQGLTSTYIIKAIKANVLKETGGVPQNENLAGYAFTSNTRIREIFGSRFASVNDDQLTILKKNTPEFAEYIYGLKSGKTGVNFKNTQKGDAYKYRGRSYIGITGKDLYTRAGAALGKDFVNNPDSMNTPENAASTTVWYIRESLKVVAPRSDYRLDPRNPQPVDQLQANLLITNCVGGVGLRLTRPSTSAIFNEIINKVDSYSMQV